MKVIKIKDQYILLNGEIVTEKHLPCYGYNGLDFGYLTSYIEGNDSWIKVLASSKEQKDLAVLWSDYFFNTIGGIMTGVYYPDERDSVMGYYPTLDEAYNGLFNWIHKNIYDELEWKNVASMLYRVCKAIKGDSFDEWIEAKVYHQALEKNVDKKEFTEQQMFNCMVDAFNKSSEIPKIFSTIKDSFDFAEKRIESMQNKKTEWEVEILTEISSESCTCNCHHNDNVMHIMACCNNGVIRRKTNIPEVLDNRIIITKIK